MNEMIEFSKAILDVVCEFLATPPVFYLFGLVCFAAVCGVVRSLLKFRS